MVDAIYGKASHTRYEVLKIDRGRTRVAFRPITGRTHQLRVHAAHPQGLGCPIVGDRLYGRGGRNNRMYLHSERLVLRHPVSDEEMEFIAPTPF